MLDKQQQNQNLGPKNVYSTQYVIHLCQRPRRVKCRRRPLRGFTQISPPAFSLAGEQFSLSLQRPISSRILHSISGMTVVKFWAKSQLETYKSAAALPEFRLNKNRAGDISTAW